METGYQSSGNDERFFRRRHNPTVALIAGLLLFLLPFARVKCGSMVVAENTGVGMVTGKQWKMSFTGFDNGPFEDADESSAYPLKKGKPQGFVLFAAIFALCGLILCFTYLEMRAILTMVSSILAALFLGAAYFGLKMQLKSVPFDDMYEGGGFSSGSTFIRVQFTPWYFIAVAAFAAAAVFSFKHNRIELADKEQSMALFDFQTEEEKKEEGATDLTV